MEIDVWQKIADDPEAELKALAKRMVPYLEDSQFITDHVRFHFVMMAWSQIGRLAEELAISRAMAQDSSVTDVMAEYYQSTYAGKIQLALIPIRAFREQLDELDAKKPAIESTAKMVRDSIAEDIRRELVCPCGIYDQINACWKPEPGYEFHVEDGRKAERELMRSPGYHAICHWGEYAARIAEGSEE